MIDEVHEEEINEEFEKDPNVQKARTGVEMRSFWNSKAGEYFEKRINEQIDDGVAELLKIDPVDDVKEFRKVQLRMNVAQQILIWINEAIQEGEIAVENIAKENDNLEGFRTPNQ